jgi:hypothetical protein
MMNDHGMGLGMGFGWLGTIVVLILVALTIAALITYLRKCPTGRNRHELHVQSVGNRGEL